jgi:hypothetical protein
MKLLVIEHTKRHDSETVEDEKNGTLYQNTWKGASKILSEIWNFGQKKKTTKYCSLKLVLQVDAIFIKNWLCYYRKLYESIYGC